MNNLPKTIYHHRGGGRGGRSLWKTVTSVLLFGCIYSCLVMSWKLASYVSLESYQHLELPSQVAKQNDGICPSAQKLFDQQSLKEMIEKAKDFHLRGGNLVSVENYLNEEIQSSLDKLKLKFEFKEEQPQATGDAIHDLGIYYKTHTIPRGGYGQPLPGKFVGDMARKDGPLFGERWINVIEPYSASRFKIAIGEIGPSCKKEIHFAEKSYEGKVFCVPPDSNENDNRRLRETSTKSSVIDECNIFSIGSNDQWKFEREVIQKMPNCVTHTFDCTLKNNQPRRKPASDKVRFYPYCISEETTSVVSNGGEATQQFLPYDELWKRTNTTQAPKLLKIDVEGFEYGVIPSMLRNSPPEIWPEQIAMEVHWATRMVDVPSFLRTRTAAESALFFGQLFNVGGYLPVKAKYFEPYSSCMVEVLLVRVLC